MRGGSGRPARIKSRNMKKLLFTLLFCAAAAAAAGSEPAELKLLSYNIRYIGAPGDEGDFAWDARKEASVTMIRDVKPSSNSCPNTATSKWDATSAPRTIPASI